MFHSLRFFQPNPKKKCLLKPTSLLRSGFAVAVTSRGSGGVRNLHMVHVDALKSLLKEKLENGDDEETLNI